MEELFNYFAGNTDSMTLTLVIIAMSVLLVFLILLAYIPTLTKKCNIIWKNMLPYTNFIIKTIEIMVYIPYNLTRGYIYVC